MESDNHRKASARRTRRIASEEEEKIPQSGSGRKAARAQEPEITVEAKETNMRRMSKITNGNGYYTRRAAQALHEGIDRLADRGEQLERRLQDGYQRVDRDAHEIYSSVRSSVHHHPWRAVGSSAAIGFIIGFLSSARR